MNTELEVIAQTLAAKLCRVSLKMTVAESCTGGWVSQSLTALPGSSQWFEGGVVTYSNALKQRLLGVSPAMLAADGAVSESVACAMAAGAVARLGGDVALSVTGIAGPSGAVAAKPVGTVWIAWASASKVHARCFQFKGDRESIRYQSVKRALEGMLAFVLD